MKTNMRLIHSFLESSLLADINKYIVKSMFNNPIYLIQFLVMKVINFKL